MGAGLDALARDLIMVQETGCRRVGLLRAVKKDFERIEKRFRLKLLQHFDHYGIPGTTMPDEHFKSEGHFPSGGQPPKNVHVFVFKAFQCRIYGITKTIEQIETFIGMEIDKKKSNRADQ